MPIRMKSHYWLKSLKAISNERNFIKTYINKLKARAMEDVGVRS